MTIKSETHKFLLFILLLFSLTKCSNGKYADFDKDSSGLQYKILYKTESRVQLKTGDIVELKMIYKNNNDSVLFNSDELGRPFRMQIEKISHKGGSFENALLILKPGERALFIISADSFYTTTMHKKFPDYIKKGSDLLFDITIVKKLNQQEIEEERSLLAQHMKEQEDNLIKQYIEENKISFEPKLSGLYYIEIKKGTGRIAKSGDRLEVNYTGMLINGKIFSSSYQQKEPFKFRLGKKEVIDGWEEGFSYMCEGGKAKLIIPSHLAYGKDGYGKIIPPYSTLVFDVELLNIK